jgi:hypothetical protein
VSAPDVWIAGKGDLVEERLPPGLPEGRLDDAETRRRWRAWRKSIGRPISGDRSSDFLVSIASRMEGNTLWKRTRKS